MKQQQTPKTTKSKHGGAREGAGRKKAPLPAGQLKLDLVTFGIKRKEPMKSPTLPESHAANSHNETNADVGDKDVDANVLFNQPYSPLVIRTVKNESFTGKVSQFIDGDGNCLFRCLSWFMHKGDQSHHRDIRRKIVGHFRKRSNVFERLAAIDNMSLDDLCAKYETNGEFGDEYCLASFCDLYQMEVTVFSNINTQYHVTVFTPQARPASYMKISLHLSVSSDHYEVVLDSTQEFETAPTVPNVSSYVPASDEADGEDDDDGDSDDDEDHASNNSSTTRKRFIHRTDPNAAYLTQVCAAVRRGDHDAQLKLGNVLILPPDPVSSLRKSVLRGGDYSPEFFLYSNLVVCNPYLTCDESNVVCPNCNSNNTRQSGYSEEPRRIYGINGLLYYLLAARGTCQDCKHKFRTTNAVTVSKLLLHYQPKFNQTLTKRAGVDDELVFLLRNGLYQGLGPAGVHSLQRQKATYRHSLSELQYYSVVESLMVQSRTQPSVSMRKVIDPNDIPPFPSFTSPDYDGGYPSINYLKKILVKDNLKRRDWLDFEVQRRSGTVLSIDHYYKICKHLAPINGHRLFKALFTAKNEYREIRLQALTQSSGHLDLIPLFRSHERTREYFGYSPITLVYTDKCCSDRSFLQSVLEQSLPVGTAAKPLLPLPDNPLCVRLLSTERPTEITTALARIIQHIRSLPNSSRMPLGLDTEWKVGPRGKEGKIQLLQLAIKEKLLNDESETELILLVVLKDRFDWPPYLKEVVESRKTLKIGSRIVAADFKYLNEDWGIQPRSLDSADICDTGHLCKRKGFVEKANASLSKCCAAVLGYCLDKSDSVRCSDWSKPRYSQQQKDYAARDAWAGLLIFLQLQNAVDTSFSRLVLPTTVPEPQVLENDSAGTSADSLFRQLLEVENGVTVKLDSVHGMMRIELPKKHPMAGVFAKKLRDAIFILNPEDVKRVDEYLRTKGTTFEEELLRNPDWCLKRVRRSIPSSDILYDRVNELLIEFSLDSYKDEKGVPLLSAKAKKDMKTLLNDHIRKGCLSDPVDFPLYTRIGDDKDGLPLYATFRGTSDVESFHQLLEQIFSSMNCSPEFMDAVLSQIRHVFNIRASERNRPGFPKIGHYEHYMIDAINEITFRIYGKPIHKWWTVTSLFRPTSETFGIIPHLPEEEWEPVTEKDVESYPRTYRFLALRTKCLIPYLPVHTPAEWRLFTQNLSFYVGKTAGGSSSKSGLENMALDWNSGKLPVCPKAPTISKELIITRKLEAHLEDAHKVLLKRLQRKDLMNKNKTGMSSLDDSLARFSELDFPYLAEFDGAEIGPFRVIFDENLVDSDSDMESYVTAEEPVGEFEFDTLPQVLQNAVNISFQPQPAATVFLPSSNSTLAVPFGTLPITTPQPATILPKKPRKPRTCQRCERQKCAGVWKQSKCDFVKPISTKTPTIRSITQRTSIPALSIDSAALDAKIELFNDSMHRLYGNGDRIVWDPARSEQDLHYARTLFSASNNIIIQLWIEKFMAARNNEE
ncbi:hypothetical protein BCR33DRAFT_772567 [Rhizoclosmatium globosum]|uniref:3'-5' exonuclease n=1 Tax=Rhizoclosmatium globosum TaxID=329046 RepID=A0A1Y2B3F5_9FUNG|nr:hypothetical protein BCR33DRAFT_772567 [Rhizoclosmatium globosum]|eukprot:ORY29256.1 hypothetical protein BCR33DRAFT_772567 [Rhizoclosmatium globosum]